MSLAGKTLFVTGGSRGIGLAIAKRAARDGANVVLAAKTSEPHPKLPGTIHTAAEECEKLGGRALALQLNVQDDDAIQESLRKAADHFGGKIDILINNASAIDNRDTASLPTKKYDLMHSVNSRGTFMMSKFAIPYLLKSKNPQVLNLSPPVDSLLPPQRPATPQWFRLCGTGYTMAKFDMTLAALGMAEELKGKVGFSCLWPKTAIATAAIDMLAGDFGMQSSRKVDIMADAAHWILSQDHASVSGQCFVDEDVILKYLGRDDLDSYRYASNSSSPLMPDFYVGDHEEYERNMKAFGMVPESTVSSKTSATSPSTTLEDKTLFVTGGSRGIGLAIAKRAAKDGANVILAAKTADPNPKLPGTIYSAAEECEKLGGRALPLQLNVQNDDAVQEALRKGAQHFGGKIDILINNASAIDNSNTKHLKRKKYDLMYSINSRGTFMVSKFALPYLLKGENAHVLNLAPPIDLHPTWFKLGGTAYTIAKYNMAMCAVGMAEEYRGRIGFNNLWPRTSIATAAVKMLAGNIGMNASRNVNIMSDAAHWILTQDNTKISGNCFVDENVILNHMGKSKSTLDQYKMNKWFPLIPDLFVGDPKSMEKYVDLAKMFGGLGSFFEGKS